jgi:hypothetical protein
VFISVRQDNRSSVDWLSIADMGKSRISLMNYCTRDWQWLWSALRWSTSMKQNILMWLNCLFRWPFAVLCFQNTRKIHRPLTFMCQLSNIFNMLKLILNQKKVQPNTLKPSVVKMHMWILSCVLRAFEKLRKANISFVMSVCLSAWNNSSPTRRIFMKCDIW